MCGAAGLPVDLGNIMSYVLVICSFSIGISLFFSITAQNAMYSCDLFPEDPITNTGDSSFTVKGRAVFS